ncbi:hypothetical protein [Daejeonella oryzae]|uniref:hypothetical protein n=1 Tax=Daejeonella oryzae TaxID=1122943 RepID=UPI000684E3C6|nr:hypothetical protein [Daejeonella oryzae]
MIRIKQILLTILTVPLLAGCDFISNTFKYKDTTKVFMETLIKEDYNKCVDLMAMDYEIARNTNVDTMKLGLANFRKLIVDNWGTDLEYSLMKSEKKFSTVESENTPPNTTLVLVEFSNIKDFGVLQVLFDDKSKKILNIKTLDVKGPIPSMTIFWLFGLIAICIPIFNIYVIRQIKHSDLNKKWIKYIAIIFLNVPAITYAAVNGLSFNLLNFQILFGFSFGYMGYLNSYWTFGIPLGGLYWFWKLKQRKDEVLESESTVDQNVETEPTYDNLKPMAE